MLLVHHTHHDRGTVPCDAAALYEYYYPLVLTFVRRRVADHMQAEDIAAQTFARALTALDRYEDRGRPPTAWLLRIATYVLIDDARRRRHETPLDDAMLWQLEARPSPEPAPEAWAERRESAAWLERHLATLTADQRHALWLRYGEDRAIADVATRIGRSPAATKQLLHRAVTALRAQIPAETGLW